MRVITWNLEEYDGSESSLWQLSVPYLFVIGGMEVLLLQGALLPGSESSTGEVSIVSDDSDNTPVWPPELGPPPGTWSYGLLLPQDGIPGSLPLHILWWQTAGDPAPKCQAVVWSHDTIVRNLLFVQASQGGWPSPGGVAGIGIGAAFGSRQCNVFTLSTSGTSSGVEQFVLQAALLGPDWIVGGGFGCSPSLLSARLAERACPNAGTVGKASSGMAGDYILNAHGPLEGVLLPDFTAGNHVAIMYDE